MRRLLAILKNSFSTLRNIATFSKDLQPARAPTGYRQCPQPLTCTHPPTHPPSTHARQRFTRAFKLMNEIIIIWNGSAWLDIGAYSSKPKSQGWLL